MKAIIKVSQAAAIKAGSNQYGDISIEYDPADLNQDQRDEMARSWVQGDGMLANPIDGGFVGNTCYNDGGEAASADLDTLRYLLDLRILWRAHDANKERARIDKIVKEYMDAPMQQLIRQHIKQKTSRDQDTILDRIIPVDERYRFALSGIYTDAIGLNDATVAQYPGLRERIEIMREDAAPILAQIIEEDKVREAQWKENRRRHDEEQARKEKEQELKAQAEEEERRAWIAEHGSERLQLMIETGVEYRRTYEIERAALEHPGYELAPKKSEHNDRANPSLEALQECKRLRDAGYTANILWITIPAEDYDDESEGFEAVGVDRPWCRPWLIKRF